MTRMTHVRKVSPVVLFIILSASFLTARALPLLIMGRLTYLRLVLSEGSRSRVLSAGLALCISSYISLETLPMPP